MIASSYILGFQRGEDTGRAAPTDRDWQWFAENCEDSTDPQEGVEFETGMADGAAHAADQEVETPA